MSLFKLHDRFWKNGDTETVCSADLQRASPRIGSSLELFFEIGNLLQNRPDSNEKSRAAFSQRDPLPGFPIELPSISLLQKLQLVCYRRLTHVKLTGGIGNVQMPRY